MAALVTIAEMIAIMGSQKRPATVAATGAGRERYIANGGVFC